DSRPVLTLALSGDRSLRELSEIADKTVKVQLERSKGVGEVDINGDISRTVNIDVDADRLAALGLSITAVRDAVERENAEIPGRGRAVHRVSLQGHRCGRRAGDRSRADHPARAVRPFALSGRTEKPPRRQGRQGNFAGSTVCHLAVHRGVLGALAVQWLPSPL